MMPGALDGFRIQGWRLDFNVHAARISQGGPALVRFYPKVSACHGNASLGEVKSVLCLSNGHGEDTIAAAILTELQSIASEKGAHLKLEALPLVGIGHAYIQSGIMTLGPSKTMPSGGFIYMDSKQLFHDLRAGLLALTFDQWPCLFQDDMKWRTLVHWVNENPNGFVLAVGDVLPLLFAWGASRQSRKKYRHAMDYAFVGTAKSEYYVRGEDGHLLQRKWPVDSYLLSGSVYYPWEQALMANNECRLVLPRDALTSMVLKECLPPAASSKVCDLGNPMMDGLHPTGALDFLKATPLGRIVTLLPGSRAPEVYANWRIILEAAREVSKVFAQEKLMFLAPVVPSLQQDIFVEALTAERWLQSTSTQVHQGVMFEQNNAVLLLLKGGFNDTCHWGDAGIAMAGTATEQLVGLGKPVFTIAGSGPQYTYAFAEAQTRLLGKSVFLCSDPVSLARKMQQILSNKACLVEIMKNGLARMGTPGAARRISEHLLAMFQI